MVVVTALSSGAVEKRVDLIQVFKDGTVEYHLGPQKDFTDKPEEIFTMRGDMLHISGRGWGYMATKDDFSDYHLVVEFKWGTQVHGSRTERARDNGILYHASGPHGAVYKTWPASFEANIIQGGMGDLLVLSGKDPQTDAPITYRATFEALKDPNNQWKWQRGAPRVTVESGRLNWQFRDPQWKDVLNFRGERDLEAPLGEWNRLEVIAHGKDVVHRFNGQVVAEAFDLSPHAGKVCIQTECAEMLVRRYELWPLDTFKEPWPNKKGE